MIDDRNRLVIRLEEGVRFSRELATPVARMLAVLVDWLAIIVLTLLFTQLTAVVAAVSIDLYYALFFWIGFSLNFGYPLLLEWRWGGQTLGKKMLRLRVVDASGLRLQFHQILIRNLIRLVDILPFFYLLGGAVAFLSRKSQRLGDIAANTVVIRMPKLELPDLEQIRAGKYNSLLAHPHLAARLRQRVEPALAACLLDLVLRRDQFTPEARISAFAQAAELLRETVRFPEETLEWLTDEQFVRNVVDCLFRELERKVRLKQG